MPLFLASLLGGLISIAGTLAGRALIAVGFGFVSYTGITTALTAFKNDVISHLGALSASTVNVLGMLKVDVAISILFSALAARLVLQGLTSGALKRLVAK